MLLRNTFSHETFTPSHVKSVKPGGIPGGGGGAAGWHAILFEGLLPQRGRPSHPCDPQLVFFCEPGVKQQMLADLHDLPM